MDTLWRNANCRRLSGLQPWGTAENIQIELRDDQDATLKNGDSKTVIVDEITRNAQFPLKARAITVNGNASQGTIEALINVIYTWQ
ncbi:hypothetical protein C0X04_000394 [Escherichia coli]|nr:hypothetical protein [Escherichia coli]